MKRVTLLAASLAALTIGILDIPVAGQTRPATRPAAKAPAKSAAPAKRRPRPAAPRSERPVPFRMGEVLTYDVSWSSYVTAGTATVTVREKKPSYGSTAYYIVAEGRPTPLLSKLYTLYYKADTLLDSYTLLPAAGRRSTAKRARTGARRPPASTRARARRSTKCRRPPTSGRTSRCRPTRRTRCRRSTCCARSRSSRAPRSRCRSTDSGAHVQGAGDGRQVASPCGRPARRSTPGEIAPAVSTTRASPPAASMAMWISDDEKKLPLKLQAELAVGSFQADAARGAVTVTGAERARRSSRAQPVTVGGPARPDGFGGRRPGPERTRPRGASPCSRHRVVDCARRAAHGRSSRPPPSVAARRIGQRRRDRRRADASAPSPIASTSTGSTPPGSRRWPRAR